MFQAALLETMKTALAPWRTAVSISMALMPKAPSPLTEITCRSGHAPAPRRSRTARRRRGSRRRRRPCRSRACEPDAREAQEVAAVGDGDVVGIGDRGDGVEDRARMDLAVGAGRRPVLAPRRRDALAVAPRAVRRPRPCRCSARGCRRPRPWRRARAAAWRAVPARRGGCRSARPALSAMRMKRAFGKHRRRAVADLVVELAADHAARRRPRVIAAARTAPTTEGWSAGTRPRLSCVSR